MSDAAPRVLQPAVLRRLAAFGIRQPSPDIPLHRDLVDAVERLMNAPEGVLNQALMWAWLAELDRQGRTFAQQRTMYERALGRAIVRYRHEGEKSAAVAEKRAEAEDQDVMDAHLAYRVAEQGVQVARQALAILQTSNDNWRTEQANARKQDSFHADHPAG